MTKNCITVQLSQTIQRNYDIFQASMIFSCLKLTHRGLPWWRHEKKLSTLLGLLWGNLPVTGAYPSQGASIAQLRCFPIVSKNRLLDKQSQCRWIGDPKRSYDVTSNTFNFSVTDITPSSIPWRPNICARVTEREKLYYASGFFLWF